METFGYFLTVVCISILHSSGIVTPAATPFNKHKLAIKYPKRGNGLRRSFSKDSVKYFLYQNASNPENSTVLRIGDVGSLTSYNPSIPLTMIIHGFKQNYTDKHPQALKNGMFVVLIALLKKDKLSNIVVISWLGISLPFKNLHSGIPLSTREASKNIQRISKHIVEFISYLRNETKLNNAADVHIIGYGLGAQIAGVVGFRVKQSTGESIGRITGLDPSGPQHTYTALSEKLDKTDGNFVDVIHTANGPFGLAGSIGHVDYYPNGGGPTQPNCILPTDPIRDLPGFPGSCSSALSWDYYIRSVMEDNVKACEAKSFLSFKLGNICQNQITFGHRVSQSARGDYFLSIRSQES
ncbi:Pancreatic triacylglycerol lipase [Orchesella cincta]|uniref:Pancreatic triacylglycerol lipase n=1 Tax=Orchesella cincta TaxID=48709 RepID=A0A1D2NFK0_ORCCI|nr:Pancreatic triacylglycerol lipase [Orchesella cincta]